MRHWPRTGACWTSRRRAPASSSSGRSVASTRSGSGPEGWPDPPWRCPGRCTILETRSSRRVWELSKSARWISIRVLLLMPFRVRAAGASSGPPLHPVGPDQLFERGMAAYEARKWSEAIRAFERITMEYPTHPRIQEARFRLADSYFGRKEYVTAASEFVRLATDYPSGSWADDARVKACEAYYELSPKPALDQQDTPAAIHHCRSLGNHPPSSEFAPLAEAKVAELRNKLAVKVLESAEFYYQRKAYDPAILYFEDVLREYPDTPVVPRALLRLVEIYVELGYEEEAEAARQRL